jgi:molybdopterin molybdotransferase
METGLSVAAAQERIIARFRRLPPESVDLATAHGRTLAADAIAAVDLPPFTQSAMDGYAVRAEETAGASATTPVHLRVIGTHAAGDAPALTVAPGTAVAIATGAPVPTGANAVVRIEHTDGGTAAVSLQGAVGPGANIRFQGESVPCGSIVLPAGAALSASRIALLAATGTARPSVVRHPRVGIISTGKEIVSAGVPLGPGQTWDVNTPMLSALITEAGGEVIPLGIAPDTTEGLLGTLHTAVGVDCIITSGGVSVGTYDVVRAVLAEHGAVHFWRIRMRPGAPVTFGAFGDTPLVALPGNPVAAFVAFALFVRPALGRMLGWKQERLQTIVARLLHPVAVPRGYTLYLRARLLQSERVDGGLDVDTSLDQTVGNVVALGDVNALVIVPEGVTRLVAGETVSVIPLRT